MLYGHIVNDVRNINKVANNQRLNRDVQRIVYGMLEDANTIPINVDTEAR